MEKELNEYTSLEEILTEMNNFTFSKENWINNNFYKIPEITYSYEKDGENIVNISLFSDIGELDIEEFKKSNILEKEKLIKSASKITENKITEKINEINIYIQKLENVKDGNNKVLNAKRDIILGGLKENIDLLQLAIDGLIFEEEKAIIGIYFKGDIDKKKESSFYIDENTRAKKLKKIEATNSKTFGGKLSDNPEYIEGNIDYLYDIYTEYGKKEKEGELKEGESMTNEEKERYEGYLNKLQGFAPNHQPKIRKKPQSVISDKWKNIMMNREDFKNSLNHSLVAHDIQTGSMYHRVKFDKNVSTFTDTPDGLLFPLNEKYDQKSVYEFLMLNIHENEQHGVAQISHEMLVGNSRGAKNLEVVEGMAVLAEDMFNFGENLYIDGKDINGDLVKIIDLEKISYAVAFPKIIMNEILSDKEFYDFLHIHNKIEPDWMKVEDRYLRVKRTGYQRKDTTYTIGKIKAAKYFNDIITGKIDGDFSDLYIGKIGFQDIENMKILKKDFEEKNKNTKEGNEINLPENLFFSEYVYFRLIKKNNTDRDFYTYIKKKYPFINIEKLKLINIKKGFSSQVGAVLRNIKHSEKLYNVKNNINKTKVYSDEKGIFGGLSEALNKYYEIKEKKVIKELKTNRKKSKKILDTDKRNIIN